MTPPGFGGSGGFPVPASGGTAFGPALAESTVNPVANPTNGLWIPAGVVLADNAVHQIISLALGAGKWCVVGKVCGFTVGDVGAAALSLVTASLVALPGQVVGGGTGFSNAPPIVMAAYITLAAPATIFLNASDSNGVTHTPTIAATLDAVQST